MADVPDSAPPPGIRIHSIPGGIRIVRRWRTTNSVAAPIALFVCLAVLVGVPLASLELQEGAGWFRLLLVGVIVSPLWIAALNLLNSTTYEADATGLRIRHGPLPGRRNRSFPRRDIQQLFVAIYRTSDRFASPRSVNTGTLMVELEGASAPREVDDMPVGPAAKFIERHLEAALGIVDKAPRHPP